MNKEEIIQRLIDGTERDKRKIKTMTKAERDEFSDRNSDMLFMILSELFSMN